MRRCDSHIGYAHKVRFAARDGYFKLDPTASADEFIAIERANARIHGTVCGFIVFQMTWVGVVVATEATMQSPVILEPFVFERVSEFDAR